MSTLSPQKPRSPFRKYRVVTLLLSLMTISLVLGIMVFACVARAAPPSPVNDDWQVSGDVQARPVQAFDDGQQLYLQLRNPSEPPAAVGPTGPLAYTMHGHYMVLPIVSSVHLQYGPYRANVQSARVGVNVPGVVSVHRPVDVYASAPQPQTPPAPTWKPQSAHVAVPTAVFESQVPPQVSGTASHHGIFGGIVTQPVSSAGTVQASGVRGQIVANATGGSQSTIHANASNRQTVSYSDARAATTWEGRSQKHWRIQADGTAVGARAALDSHTVCQSVNATCTIEYRGAPAGTIVISENL